jgi:hypothetical protein
MSPTPGSTTPNGGGELMQLRAIDRWPRGITCDGGFKLLGTPLGFSGSAHPGLLFYSGIDDATPPQGQRILATPFAVAAIGASVRGLDALVLDYERKVRLGRMDIRLLSSGFGPGSAVLEIGFQDRRILYCGGVRMATPLLGLPANPSPCDLLLLDAAPAAPRGIAPRTSARRLDAALRQALADGVVALVACSSRAAAIEAAHVLSQIDAPLLACRPIFEMLRRVERFGLVLPRMRRLEQTWPSSGAVLHYAHLLPQQADEARRSRVIAVGPAAAGQSANANGIRMGEGADRSGLVEFALKTEAAHVALGPRCDEQTAAMLEKAGALVYRVHHPTQIPLPL